MNLRKCPNCRDMVGADSPVCPRCGGNFRHAIIRRIVLWTLSGLVLLGLIYHFVPKK